MRGLIGSAQGPSCPTSQGENKRSLSLWPHSCILRRTQISPGCPLLETHSSAFQVCMDHCQQMLQVQMVCGMQRILQCSSCQGVEAEQGWGRAPCQRRASGTRAPAQAGPGRHAGRRCAYAAPPPPAAAARGSWRTARRRSSSGSRTPAAAPFRPVTPRGVRAHDDTSWLPVYCHHHQSENVWASSGNRKFV